MVNENVPLHQDKAITEKDSIVNGRERKTDKAITETDSYIIKGSGSQREAGGHI